MITAFVARPIVEFKQRDKSKIESLVAHGDRLLVGLNTGVLRVYRVPEGEEASGNSATAATPALLLREVEKFAPRAIEQLAIVKEANTLVSLANYAVSLHDLRSFAPLPGAAPLPGTKNASAFAVTSNIVKDAATGVPEIVSRLAVAVKRRLLLWSWFASELSSGVTTAVATAADAGKGKDNKDSKGPPYEVTLSETIRSLTWASSTRLVVGMNAGYVLVDVLTRTVEDIVGGLAGTGGDGGGGSSNGNGGAANGSNSGITGSDAVSRFGALSSAGMGYMGLGSYMPKPLAAKLADGQVLLAKDVHTLFITDEGKALEMGGDSDENRSRNRRYGGGGGGGGRQRPIPWTTAPESIGYSYPYILALQAPAKGTLEVRSPDTLSLLQTLALPGATQLHVAPPSASLAHAGKGFHVSSERGVWKMDATAYDSQVDALVARGDLDEAISLVGLVEDALLRNKAATLCRIKMAKAERLFRQKKYLASMDLFNEEDVHAPPEQVLRFFPRSLVGDLSDEPAPAPPPEDETATEEEEEDGDEEEAAEGSGNDQTKAAIDADTEATATTDTNGSKETKEGKPSAGTSETATPAPSKTSSGGSGFAAMFLGRRALANAETASIASSRKEGGGESDADTASEDKAKAKTAPEGGRPGTGDYVPLEGKDLMSAAEALNSYLAGTRARLQRQIDPATGKLKAGVQKAMAEAWDDGHGDERNGGGKATIKNSKANQQATDSIDGDDSNEDDDDDDNDIDSAEEALAKKLRTTFTLVDTTMFRVLMLIRPKLASSLFRIPNFCDPAVVNEQLLAHSRYNELVDFFYGKKLHRQALELLRRFGEAEGGEGEEKKEGEGGEEEGDMEEEEEEEEEEKEDDKPEATGNGETKEAKMGKKVKTRTKVQPDKTKKPPQPSAPTVPPELRGPQRTVAYLQSLPAEMLELVLEFSAWTLRADPARGMEVFLADSENAETLPRDRVARFLAGIDPRLEMQYLEHIVGELNDLTPDFHNRLVEQMIKLLREGRLGSEAAGEKRPGLDGTAEVSTEAMAARLVAFLRQSRQYSLSRAFGLLPRDDPTFYEAQAVVLSIMGQHKQALEIYVFKMKDYAKAEEYCNRINQAREQTEPAAAARPAPGARSLSHRRIPSGEHQQPDDPTSPPGDSRYIQPSIYHTLLSLYLMPPPGQPRQLTPALALLSRHGSRLPASSTLHLIPDGLPVAELAAYFRGRIRAANSIVNETRIERGLRQTGVLAAQAALLLGDDVDDVGFGMGRATAAAMAAEAANGAAAAAKAAGGAPSSPPGAASPSSPAFHAAAAAGRNRRVVISEERVCGVCYKRLGGSVVAVLPDNSVVHYGCLKRAGVGGGGGVVRGSDGGRVERGSWR